MSEEDQDDIVTDALDEYRKAKDAWSEVYDKARNDLYFLSDEPFAQWDDREAADRYAVGRPAYQVDQLSQFIHQVTNDIRMNTPMINVAPDGDGSDVETAKIFEGLIKAIEYNSKADAAYDTAADFSVRSSIGFIRVDHDYTTATGFEQELLIKRVINPQSVFIDPDSTESDGSDAMYAFVLEELTSKDFKKKYPDFNPVSFCDNPFKAAKDTDKIVVAEYFCIVEDSRTMGLLDDGSVEEYDKTKQYKSSRKVSKRKVMRYKLSGQDVLEETTFPGIYIPVVPVYGEESWIEGRRNLYSLIRKAKDPQRMFNLWASTETELLLKQPEAPVMAAVGQMRGFEEDWKRPAKAMVLYYHTTDVYGNNVPPPERLGQAQIPAGIVNAKRETVDDIKASLGMYNASIGERSNETSGVAINARKREGDVATFHFADNLVRSITQVGRILVFAIPEIYDTPRVIKIVGQEDEVTQVAINGANPLEEQKQAFDLRKGKYDVRVQTGPSFTTQRQEAAAQYNQLIQAMPDLMPVIGDLVFKYQDTAGSQAISSRLKKLVDPKFLDDSEKDQNQPDPQVMQLQQQLQQITQAAQTQIQQLQTQLADKQGELQIKAAEVQVKSKDVDIKALQAQTQAQEAQKGAPVVDNTADVMQQSRKLDIEEYKTKEDVRLKELGLLLDGEKLKLEMFKLQTAAPASGAVEESTEGEPAGDVQKTQQNEILAGIMQRIDQLTQAISQPIQVIRDESGMITGAV